MRVGRRGCLPGYESRESSWAGVMGSGNLEEEEEQEEEEEDGTLGVWCQSCGDGSMKVCCVLKLWCLGDGLDLKWLELKGFFKGKD